MSERFADLQGWIKDISGQRSGVLKLSSPRLFTTFAVLNGIKEISEEIRALTFPYEDKF